MKRITEMKIIAIAAVVVAFWASSSLADSCASGGATGSDLSQSCRTVTTDYISGDSLQSSSAYPDLTVGQYVEFWGGRWDHVSGLPPGLKFEDCDFCTKDGMCTACIDKLYGTPTKAGNYRVTFYETNYRGGPVVNKETRTIIVRPSSGDGDDYYPDFGIFDSAQVFNGWLTGSHGIGGTIQVKTSKASINRKAGFATSKVTAVVQYFDYSGDGRIKKATYKGSMNVEGEWGYVEVEGRNGDSIYLEIAADGVYVTDGVYGGYSSASGDDFEITAYRDIFSSKNKDDAARATEVLGKWQKTLVFALDDCCSPDKDLFTVTIGAKGKAKVSGTMQGQKFSLTTQLVVGEYRCYLPMVARKDSEFHHVLYLEDDGTISDGGEVLSQSQYGTPGSFSSGGYFFVEDADELTYLIGGDAFETYSEYIPDWWNRVRITANGSRWTLPKAGRVVLNRKTGEIDESKLGENPSGLKLSYRAKDGTFSGSFKAYVNKNGKPSAVTVSVSGIMINGYGYGMATVKKSGSVGVRIIHETAIGIEW